MRIEDSKQIYREIQALARADYGGNTGALLVVYAIEGFLRRLAASDYADQMTLKGGMLMAASSARRMTRDADLATTGVDNDEANVVRVATDILATAPQVGDGLAFDTASIRTEIMREDAAYHGVRVKLTANLASARIPAMLDFSFGDPHRSTIIELPELLGTNTIRLASYPPEASIAEKTATMMSRRELNTRDRDLADVWVLSRVHSFIAGDLLEAITEVAAHREHEVVALAVALADLPDRQASYTAMLARMAYQRPPPDSWIELIADVQAFIDPPVTGAVAGGTVWDPSAARWTS